MPRASKRPSSSGHNVPLALLRRCTDTQLPSGQLSGVLNLCGTLTCPCSDLYVASCTSRIESRNLMFNTFGKIWTCKSCPTSSWTPRLVLVHSQLPKILALPLTVQSLTFCWSDVFKSLSACTSSTNKRPSSTSSVIIPFSSRITGGAITKASIFWSCFRNTLPTHCRNLTPCLGATNKHVSANGRSTPSLNTSTVTKTRIPPRTVLRVKLLKISWRLGRAVWPL